MAGEPGLALWAQGHEARQTSGGGAAVTEEEEEEKQGETDLKDEAHHSRHHGAAGGESEGEQRPAAVEHPGSDLRGWYGHELADPPKDLIQGRHLEEIARLGDAVALSETLEPAQELRGLAREDDPRYHRGNEHEERTGQCEEDGGETRSTAELPGQEVIERADEQGEETRPQDRLEERLEDGEEGHGQQPSRHHPERPRVEAALLRLAHAGLLQLDVEPLSGGRELHAGLRAGQLHHHAVLVLKGDHGHAAAHRRASFRGRVVAREIFDFREVIDLAARAHLGDAEVDHAQPLDAEGVRLALVLELAVAPRDADTDGDRLAVHRHRAGGLLVGRREAADAHERRHRHPDPRSPHGSLLSRGWKICCRLECNTRRGIVPSMTTFPLALDGIRVIDLSRVIAGPWCGALLADLGADVIKVEDPGGGDESRTWPPHKDGEAAAYLLFNRNKRGLQLDLKQPEAVEVVKALVASADVVIENFRTGTMESFGLGYDALAAINPRLIYCSISAFGRTGPRKDSPGYEALMQAFSGIMSITGEPGGQPVRAGVSFLDLSTGILCALGVCAAVIQREKTGLGQRVDGSLLETAVSLLAFHAEGYLLTGALPRALGSRSEERRVGKEARSRTAL